MPSSFFKSATISLIIGVASTLALAAPASAHHSSSSFGFQIGGPEFSIRFGDHGYRKGREHRRDRGYRRNRSCNPHRALRKARRMGIHRAHIVRVNRRKIIVAGRRWGERTIVGFSRHGRCSVRFVRGGW